MKQLRWMLAIQIFAFLALVIGMSGYSFAAAGDPISDADVFSGKVEMNGIPFKDYEDFEKKWRLVTVRYRKDTGELRWTFANEMAWKVLESGSTQYPEGAVFAKVGVVTGEDPQFSSSMVPIGARRFQFMVRDPKKYAETGGWGYALFDQQGKTYPEDPQKTAVACYACHRIVDNRGQVFSQPFQLAAKLNGAFLSPASGFRKIEFEWIQSSTLPKEIQSKIGRKFLKVRQVSDMNLRQNLFQGTLDEIRPSLEGEVSQSKTPALLMSADGKRFSLVLPTKKATCKEGRSFQSHMTMEQTSFTERKIKSNDYCNP